MLDTGDRELEDLRQNVARFMAANIEPVVAQHEDAGTLPLDLLPELAELGYIGSTLPVESGGMGATYSALAVLMEEAGYQWMSLRATLSVMNMVSHILGRSGSVEQREEYLVPLLVGQRVAFFALSEPDHGSDVRSLSTTATEQPDGSFRLTGTKMWITNGAIGDFGVLLASTRRRDGSSGGLTAFLIDPEKCDYERRRISTMFLRATTTSELTFAETRLGPGSVIGDIGDGLRVFLSGLDLGRLNVAMGAVGASRRALDMATSYALQREQFGRRIGEFQLVQEMVADIRVQTTAARALGYAVARQLDAGGVNQTDCAIVKLVATETAYHAAHQAMQVHGAMGLSTELAVERLFRDARGGTIVEGTSQIQKLVIARDQLGVSALT